MTDLSADAVVVGTGAGGAAVAAELAAGGLDVVVLEEGVRHDYRTFTARPRDMTLRLYRDAGQLATVGTPPIILPLGRAVGGTTLINSGTCFRTPARVLERWARDHGVAPLHDDVFDYVEDVIGVAEVPEALAGRNALLVKRGAEALGLSGGFLRRNAPGCRGSGVCAFGCPTGAKQHAAASWLPRAEAAGARVLTGVKVRRVLIRDGRAAGVQARGLTVRAPIVVVACGALLTPGLLRRSGVRSPALGRHLTIHPASAARARFDEPIDPWDGVPQSYYVDALADEGVMLEGIAGPPDQAALATLGTGVVHRERMLAARSTASFGVMVADSATGSVREVGGRLLVRYDLHPDDAERLRRGFELLADIWWAVGAREILVPLAGVPPLRGGDSGPLQRVRVRPRDVKAMAFHPLGTARAGADPARAVVDPDLQVHGVRGLHVADGSAVPSSPQVNPQVTIMALAVRLGRALAGARDEPLCQDARVIARSDAVAALRSERFDLAVVGGGITGAGVALDAATRGYSVALVEKADYASGTSSRSSKLVHGGLRYLQNFDLGLVREALLERQLMVKLAPHLVRPLPFVVAAFDGARPDRMVGMGLNLYDAMARGRRREEGDWEPERHRVIGGDEVVERLPALAGRAPTSGYLFYDCQTDDSRLVLTVLAEAERFGAVCANRVEVTDLLDDGGRTRGVCVRDGLSDERFEVRADNVINATGVWADRLRPDELHDEAEVPRIRPSRGSHITLAHETLPLAAGAIVPAGGGRAIFALPWLGSTLVGTTDNEYDAEDLDHVRPAEDDIAYLLGAVNAYFATALGREDITGAYAGVRPLISTGDPKKSVDISRKAELYETSSGMITITGGKLTTWRRMAKMAVDRLVEREARTAPCRTHEVPLGQAVDAAGLPRVEGVPDAAYERLAGRYGHAAHEVLAIARESGELAQPIVPGGPADLLAETVYAARREQAVSVGDTLLRRTRIGLLAARGVADPEGATARRVAVAMSAEMGWDDGQARAQAQAFLDEARAEGIVPTP